MNPKDERGQLKANLSLVPPVSIIHEAHALEDGARKYTPYNWRNERIQAHIYYAAALRHMAAWWDGEEIDRESYAHHLGHAKACLGIMLDALQCGALIDDRPTPGRAPQVLAAVALAKQCVAENQQRSCGCGSVEGVRNGHASCCRQE